MPATGCPRWRPGGARRCNGWRSRSLAGKAHSLPGELNLHQRKFLELARALASRPKLVLLDEVLCGLTPTEIQSAVAQIRRIRDQGTTIVFVEHVMDAVMALADRIVVFDQGAMLAEGAPREVMQSPAVMTRVPGGVACLNCGSSPWRTARRAPSGTSPCRSPGASCSASWGPTAPARPRW